MDAAATEKGPLAGDKREDARMLGGGGAEGTLGLLGLRCPRSPPSDPNKLITQDFLLGQPVLSQDSVRPRFGRRTAVGL